MSKNKLYRVTAMLPANTSSEKIVSQLLDSGALSVSIISREVQIECSAQNFEVIKEVLKRVSAEDIKIREAKIIENTVMQAGKGMDPSESIQVTLVPAPRLTGRKLLSITLAESFEIKEDEVPDFVQKSKKTIHKVLDKAGIDDCLIAIELLKRPKDFEKALELAIVHTLLETNGIYSLNSYYGL